jgi:23S rRNA (pseudouridine1915-N3)-methyltransferase
MKIKLIYSGSLSKKSPEQTIIDEYQKRLPWKIEQKEIIVKQKGETQKQAEAQAIQQILTDDYIVILDEKGENLNSFEFAEILKNPRLTFIIGGAYGVEENLKTKANKLISFGKLTWPHKLVRVMLFEQIYRSYTILNNHPYHKL